MHPIVLLAGAALAFITIRVLTDNKSTPKSAYEEFKSFVSSLFWFGLIGMIALAIWFAFEVKNYKPNYNAPVHDPYANPGW